MPALLVRLFFATGLTDDEVETLTTQAQAAHEADLTATRRSSPPLRRSPPFVAATVHYGIAVERAALAWFDAEPWKVGHD